MEKITEEMASKLIEKQIEVLESHGNTLNSLDIVSTKKAWSDAGLLAPAETAYEKARRLFLKLNDSRNVVTDYGTMAEILVPIVKLMEKEAAKIDRLKAEKWEDDDMIMAIHWGHDYWEESERNEYEWLAARRAAKGKE